MKYTILFSSFVALMITSCIQPQSSSTADKGLPAAVSSSLPQIGKWMFEQDTTKDQPAQWLGMKINNKTLFEPINLIIIDTISGSDSASATLILQRFASGGFQAREGHTAAYKGKMDNKNFGQLPINGSNRAFSNYMWSFTNDHARLFGPYRKDNRFYWIGAASRELGISHDYLTFKEAAGEFEQQLTKFAACKKLGYRFLDNMQNNQTDTTGDHDGYAVVLQIQ